MAGKDWTGQRFGRLVAMRNTNEKDVTGNYLWEYLCDCGNILVAKSGNVKSGHTKSCGCLAEESKLSHGHARNGKKSKTYTTYTKMLSRAKWKYEEYSRYYRDVTVCEDWADPVNGFSNFLRDMGERPEGCTLNRKRGAKEYNKENCEWATVSVQCYDIRKHHDNTSGRTGVSFRKCRNKWTASIRVDGKWTQLYYGDSFEEACAAREAAELKYYGFTKE